MPVLIQGSTGAQSEISNNRYSVSKTDHVSIASASRETGIGIETLRQWERRYGKPVPVRLPSGHRRYSQAQVAWLRTVAGVLAQGYQPSFILTKSQKELEGFIGVDPCDKGTDKTVAGFLPLIRSFDEQGIINKLKRDCARMGIYKFISERVVPVLRAVGIGWSRGEVSVRHEHFLSRILEDVLSTMRRQITISKKAPVVVLATLSDEYHGIGLHLISLLFSQAGIRTRSLGVNTPNLEILKTASETKASAIAISISLSTSGLGTERKITELRKALPSQVRLIAGGEGVRRLRRKIEGVVFFPELEEFNTWLESKPFAGAGKA